MLHGIGGRTIAEAKERLTYREALDWIAYLRKRGTLHTGMRLEAGFALLASLIVQTNGGKARMQDFMPHAREDEAVTPESVLKELMGG